MIETRMICSSYIIRPHVTISSTVASSTMDFNVAKIAFRTCIVTKSLCVAGPLSVRSAGVEKSERKVQLLPVCLAGVEPSTVCRQS